MVAESSSPGLWPTHFYKLRRSSDCSGKTIRVTMRACTPAGYATKVRGSHPCGAENKVRKPEGESFTKI
jgi:hypothetical protein